jgi:integrase
VCCGTRTHLSRRPADRGSSPSCDRPATIDTGSRPRPAARVAARGRARACASSSGGSPPQAGIRRHFAPHQLRHAHALELAREGVPLNIIQRQLGHANLGTTSIYLEGIDTEEITTTVHARRAPMMSASAGLRL